MPTSNVRWKGAGFRNIMGNQMGGRTGRRSGDPHPQGLVTDPGRQGTSLSPHAPGSPLLCRGEGETDKDSNHFLLIACRLHPEAHFTLGFPLAPKSPFLLLPGPPASESLTIPGTAPACISRATIAVVWKSFLSRTASPHRNKNSWFRKIKFCCTKQGSCLRHREN